MKSLIVLLAACVLGCTAAPNGAPDVASCCTTLIPGGADGAPGHAPNTATGNPVVVTAELQTTPGQVWVTLTRNDGGAIRGFMIQARDAAGATVGVFDVSTVALDVKQACATNGASTVTHNDAQEKLTIGPVPWNAPAGFTGDVSFFATVVESNLAGVRPSVYWAAVQSNVVTIA